MDLKILKQDISVNSEIFNQSAEYSIDTNFTIPEYYPRVNKILKCRAIPRVSSANINGQILAVDGNVTISVLYCSEENTVCGYEYTIPFNKNFEIDGDSTCAIPCCHAREEYTKCRLTDNDGIEVHGAIGINAKVLKKKSTSVISDIDGAGVVLNRGSAPATTPMGMTEKYMAVEEELELGNGQPSVKSILRYDAKVCNTDCKIMSGKVVVRGEIKVFVLYCGEQTSTPQTLRASVPYSQIIEIDGITDECESECTVEIAQLDIKPRTSITGEVRTLTMNGKVRFLATATCNDDVPVVFDAFSTKYDSEVKISDICIEKISNYFTDNFICKNKIEVNNGTIGTVIDLWCDPMVNSCRIDGENLVAFGTMQICILAYDSESNPAYFERSVDFEYKHPIPECNSLMRCKTDITLNNVSYTILSNQSIEISAELNVNATVYTCKKMSIVNEVEISEKKSKNSSADTAMIIYYAEDGEKVWDIARKYNSSPDEIIEINSITDGILACGKPLLIPVK